MNATPNSIFKFEPFSLQAIQNLKRQSIYFGSPSQFNDPFDCALIPPIKEPTDIELNAIAGRLMTAPGAQGQALHSLLTVSQLELRRTVKDAAAHLIQNQCNEFNTKKGISCFSECNDNMLMWSHYGGQHRGFCLEFRTEYEPFTKLRKVTYSSQVPEIDMAQAMIRDDYDHVLELFCTKSIDWKYEREWRAIHNSVGTLFTYKATALKSIYFGAKMSDQDVDMICLILHGQNPSVLLYRGRRSNTEFKIEFSPFSYTPLAQANSIDMA